MRVCYLNLDVVDCTADPHVLDYDSVEKMLKVMQEHVAKVDISSILPTIVELRRNFRENGIIVSDRRFK